MDITGVTSVSGAAIAASAPVRAETAAREFDALFYQIMLKTSGIFSELDAGASPWGEFLTGHIAQELARQHALGFGNLLLNADAQQGEAK